MHVLFILSFHILHIYRYTHPLFQIYIMGWTLIWNGFFMSAIHNSDYFIQESRWGIEGGLSMICMPFLNTIVARTLAFRCEIFEFPLLIDICVLVDIDDYLINNDKVSKYVNPYELRQSVTGSTCLKLFIPAWNCANIELFSVLRWRLWGRMELFCWSHIPNYNVISRDPEFLHHVKGFRRWRYITACLRLSASLALSVSCVGTLRRRCFERFEE